MSKENYLSPGERDELYRDIEANDSNIEALRQSKDQQQLLACLEKGLHLNRRLFDEKSSEVAMAAHQLCEACNVAGTTLLSQNHLKGALELLKRAEEVASHNQADKAITWNNLACYYRRTGKLRAAVTLLERALEVEEYTGPSAAAQTHLNLCATLSQLDRHQDALMNSQSAMIRIYEILSPMMVEGKLNDTPLQGEQSELVTVLCIAYHNTGVEHEYMKNYDRAICAYSEGARWAQNFLGDGHRLIGILKDSVETVKGKLKPGSGALKRAEEVLQDVQASSQRKGREMSDSQNDLVTPRDASGPRDGDETGEL